MRTLSSACVAAILLRQAALAAGVCPAFPDDAFEAAAAHNAVKCAKPTDIEAAQQPVGHLMVGNIGMASSSGATAIPGNGELKVQIEPMADALVLGSAGTASCTMDTLVAVKTVADGATTAQLRLEFEKCTAGPRTAAIVLNVIAVPDLQAVQSMYPFWKQVTTKEVTTPAPHAAEVELVFTEVIVGNSTCENKKLANYSVESKFVCKELCIADVQRYASSSDALENSHGECTSYSFNALAEVGDKNCFLYHGPPKVTQDLTEGVVGAFCYNLSHQTFEKMVTTKAPPTAAEIAAMQSALPKLNITILASQAAIQTYVSPEKCFQPFSWIALEDVNRATVGVPVKQSEWEDFLALIPEKKRRLKTAASLPAKIYADRAMFGAAPTTTVAPVAAVAAVDCPQETTSGDTTNVYVMATMCILAAAVGVCMGRGFNEAHAFAPKAVVPPGLSSQRQPAASNQHLVGGQNPGMTGQSPMTPTGAPGQMGPNGGPGARGPGGPSMGGPQGGPSGPSMGGPSGPSVGGSSGPGGPAGPAMRGPGPSGPSMGTPSEAGQSVHSGGAGLGSGGTPSVVPPSQMPADNKSVAPSVTTVPPAPQSGGPGPAGPSMGPPTGSGQSVASGASAGGGPGGSGGPGSMMSGGGGPGASLQGV